MSAVLSQFVLGTLKAAIAHIQQVSGREATIIQDDTVPLIQLGGFDSLNATEVCVRLSGVLGVKIPARVFADSRGVPKSVNAIAEAIVTRYGSKISPTLY